MFKSLKQSSQNLTGLSLEAFIGDVTAQGQNYAFYQLLSHAQIHTISSQVRSTVELFASFSLQEYKKNRQKYAELNKRQINTLKKLTLLDIFGGNNFLTFNELQSKLQLGQEEMIILLMKLNIQGTIHIKIDESNQTIKIINAEKRKVKLTQMNESALNGKVNLIKTDLNELHDKIINIKNTLQFKKKNYSKIEGDDF